MILWDMTRGLQLAVVWCGASVSWSCLNNGNAEPGGSVVRVVGGEIGGFWKIVKEDLLQVTGYYRLHMFGVLT